MKTLIAVLLLSVGMTFAQGNKPVRVPIDSAGYYAFLDQNGQKVTDWNRYDKVEIDFQNQLYKVRRGRFWGLVDSNMNVLMHPSYLEIYSVKDYVFAENFDQLHVFSNELDTLQKVENFRKIEFNKHNNKEWSRYYENQTREFKMVVHTFDGVGIMDQDLKWILEPEFDDIFFTEQIAYVRNGDYFGFLSKKNELIEPTFSSISTFNGNVVELEDGNGQRHYFLKDGTPFPLSDSTLVHSYAYNNYKIYQNGKGELYDYEVKKMVEYSGDDIYELRGAFDVDVSGMDVNQGRYSVKKNGKIGLLSDEGKVLIQPQYEGIHYAGEHLIIEQDGKFGVIDKNNNIVIAPTYTYISTRNGYYKVYNHSKKGILDANGDTLVPVEYSEINVTTQGFMTLKNSRRGFYTFEGELVLDNTFIRSHMNGGRIQFEDNRGGLCLVNTTGLITPLGCTNITNTANTLKYYYDGNVYICSIEEDVVVDTTSYPVFKTVKIHDRWTITNNIGMNESAHMKFLNQLSGKIGSLNKEDDGYAVNPQFFNVHHFGYSYFGKQSYEDRVQLENSNMKTKEYVVPFYGGSGSTGEDLLAYNSPARYTTWHTSAFDPVITTQGDYRYYSSNNYHSGSAPFILKRKGYHSAVITEGEMNFSEGQKVVRYRELYNDLNDCHNFKITNKYEFGKLSSNPTVYVKNPNWKVTAIMDDQKQALVGNLDYYEELQSGLVLVHFPEGGYNLLYAGNKRLIERDARQIIPVYIDEFELYLVEETIEELGGITEGKWTVYSGSEQLLPSHYESVKVIDQNHFKVTEDGITTIITKKGRVIYTFPRTDLVTNG